MGVGKRRHGRNNAQIEVLEFMSKEPKRQIIETATEARQAEPGPSVLILLLISTSLAVLILGVIWFAFFRT
jgi:hypothetical protein